MNVYSSSSFLNIRRYSMNTDTLRTWLWHCWSPSTWSGFAAFSPTAPLLRDVHAALLLNPGHIFQFHRQDRPTGTMAALILKKKKSQQGGDLWSSGTEEFPQAAGLCCEATCSPP